MDYLSVAIIGGFLSFLLLIINIVKGNGLSTILLNTALGTIGIFIILFGTLFFMLKALGFEQYLSGDKKNDSDDEDVEDQVNGSTIDMTVGDDDDNNIDTSEVTDYEDSLDTDYSDDDNAVSDADDDMSSYDDDRPSVNSEGASVKEKLGFDASYEDLAKAIKTKMKREE